MSSLEKSGRSSSFFHVQERDILAELLADKRSPNTRRAYERDLKDFFKAAAGQEPSPQLVAEFLGLERFTAIGLVLNYKAQLIEKGLSEATTNRRLAAIKSLVSYAQRVGKCQWSLEEVKGEKVRAYRDTSGVSSEAFAAILAIPDRSTIKGRRDYALLRLLWDNVLRRNEVHLCSVKDFSPEFRTLQILGKGKGTQKEAVTLSQLTVEAIADWLATREPLRPSDPLFTALDNASRGQRLSGDGIYSIVRSLAEEAGIKKRLSPHRIRHSGITEALNVTNGDVRRVQKLSRHVRMETLMLYDDNRKDSQGEVTDLISKLVG